MGASKLPELNQSRGAERKFIDRTRDHAHVRKRSYTEFMYTLRDCATVCVQTVGRIYRQNHYFCARDRLPHSLLSY